MIMNESQSPMDVGIIARIIMATDIPANHNEIFISWQAMLDRLGSSDTFGVGDSLVLRKLSAKEKADGVAKWRAPTQTAAANSRPSDRFMLES